MIGINELERGILLEFKSNQSKIQKDCHQAQKLQHKMKLNLDMAKKRLDYHLNLENRKTQSVLRHLSLPRNSKPPPNDVSSRVTRRDERKSQYAGCFANSLNQKPLNRFKSCVQVVFNISDLEFIIIDKMQPWNSNSNLDNSNILH